MRLTIVQHTLQWENPAANRSAFADLLTPLASLTDLIVLPEMFTTGFSMNAGALAESMDGPTIGWLREQAVRLQAALTASFICTENGRYFNRLVFVRPDGQLDYYDKRHLFTLAREHETFTPGQHPLMVEWAGWRIRPLICYDLRFPVWSRQPAGAPYDLLLYVANWPLRRGHHWRTLLPARAVENQCYVAGVNIVGTDGAGLDYQGDSGIWDYAGQAICQISTQPGMFTVQLQREEMLDYRSKLAFLADADTFTIR
ncbi:MAG: amidohydrolase [Bacteroidetes bacterium]|nr:MAG: amidohydrolase [Bacteroidota bacterium]